MMLRGGCIAREGLLLVTRRSKRRAVAEALHEIRRGGGGCSASVHTSRRATARTHGRQIQDAST